MLPNEQKTGGPCARKSASAGAGTHASAGGATPRNPVTANDDGQSRGQRTSDPLLFGVEVRLVGGPAQADPAVELASGSNRETEEASFPEGLRRRWGSKASI